MKKLLLILVCAITAFGNAQNDSGGNSTAVVTPGKKKDFAPAVQTESGEPILIGKKNDYVANQIDSGGNGAVIGNGGSKKMDYMVCGFSADDTGGSGGTTVVGGTTSPGGKKQDFCCATGEPIVITDPKKRDCASNDSGGGTVIVGTGKKSDLKSAALGETGGSGSANVPPKKKDFTDIKTA